MSEVHLKDPRTERIKKIKQGWSWTCFFFFCYGVPLFNRGLIGHGIIMVLLWISVFLTSDIYVGEFCTKYCVSLSLGDVITLGMFPFCFFYAIKGNEMGIKELQQQGWVKL